MKVNCCLQGTIGAVTSLSDAKICELDKAATKPMLLCGPVGAGPDPCPLGAQREGQRPSAMLLLSYRRM